MELLKDYIKTLILEHTKETLSGLFVSVTVLRKSWLWLLRHKKNKFSKDISNIMAFMCGEINADRSYLFLLQKNHLSHDQYKTHVICSHSVSRSTASGSNISPGDSFRIDDIDEFILSLRLSGQFLYPTLNDIDNEEIKIFATLNGVKSVLVLPVFRKGTCVGFLVIEFVLHPLKKVSIRVQKAIDSYLSTINCYV